MAQKSSVISACKVGATQINSILAPCCNETSRLELNFGLHLALDHGHTLFGFWQEVDMVWNLVWAKYTIEPPSKAPASKANPPIWHGFNRSQFYFLQS